MSSHRFAPRVALLVMALGLGACQVKEAGPGSALSNDTSASSDPAASTSAAAPAANVVTVTATDYAFDAPAEIPAGLTTIRLVTSGREMHQATLVRLEDGKTFEDFKHATQKEGPVPAWMVMEGGPNPPVPGGTTEETQMLEPGNYVIVCFVPSPDGKPHIAKGMMRPIKVTPSTAARASEPAADITVKLADYTFESSEPLTAGKRVIRIENAGPQDHELVLARMAPGKTAKELASWVENMQGPPPGEPLGGVATIKPGGVAFITADLTPGDYAFLCFVPDAKDGKPHVAHGMVHDFKVTAGG